MLVLPLAGRAGADPFGGEPGGFPFRADSPDHWYCILASIPSGDRWRFDQAMRTLDTQTDMWDVQTSACGASTDIVYYHEVNAPWRGTSMCVGWTWIVCDQYWVAVSYAQIAADPGTAGYSVSLNKTIAHETGHTAGLSHNSTTTSAMRSGPIPDLGAWNFVWGLYEPHHVSHINDAF